jgi:simple sugar transport system ATP-binding protein
MRTRAPKWTARAIASDCLSPPESPDRKTANEVAVKAVREFGITRIDDIHFEGPEFRVGLDPDEERAPDAHEREGAAELMHRRDASLAGVTRAVERHRRALPTAALGVKEAAHVLRIVLQARRRGLAVIFITHNVVHAMTVGDHFAVLIRGAKAADFRKGEKTREEITDLMAGGEAMAELESEIESYAATHEGHPPPVA